MGRRGHTLVELIAASFLVAAIVLPALELMRQSLKTGRKIENAGAMTTFCAGKLEQHLALAAIHFTQATATGDFTVEGYPELRYRVTRSERRSDGGRPGELMAVVATVWHDVNGNAARDSNEFEITLADKVANIPSYQTP